MNLVLRTLTAASLSVLATGAHAAVVTIDFDGLDGGTDLLHFERPANFYNGGFGSLGSGPGPDYGITFLPFDATSTEPRAICHAPFDCDGGKGNALFIFGDLQNGKEHGTVMHIEGGFRGIVEFDASISNFGSYAEIVTKTASSDSIITLDIIEHPDPSDTCGRLECEFAHYTINLADDPFTPDDIVAHRILFLTRGTDALFIDNIKFHDLILPDTGTPPVTVAEPSSALMLGGVGLLGAVLRRRRTPRAGD